MAPDLQAQDPIPLIQRMASYIEELEFEQTAKSSLISKLTAAEQEINNGNDASAIAHMQAFIGEVDGLRGSELPDEEADKLVYAANIIIGALL
jgi:hypothetical protein